MNRRRLRNGGEDRRRRRELASLRRHWVAITTAAAALGQFGGGPGTFTSTALKTDSSFSVLADSGVGFRDGFRVGVCASEVEHDEFCFGTILCGLSRLVIPAIDQKCH